MNNNLLRGVGFSFLLLAIIPMTIFAVRAATAVHADVMISFEGLNGPVEYHELKSGTRMVRLMGRNTALVYCRADGDHEITVKGASEVAVRALCEKVWAPSAVDASAGK